MQSDTRSVRDLHDLLDTLQESLPRGPVGPARPDRGKSLSPTEMCVTQALISAYVDMM